MFFQAFIGSCGIVRAHDYMCSIYVALIYFLNYQDGCASAEEQKANVTRLFSAVRVLRYSFFLLLYCFKYIYIYLMNENIPINSNRYR